VAWKKNHVKIRSGGLTISPLDQKKAEQHKYTVLHRSLIQQNLTLRLIARWEDMVLAMAGYADNMLLMLMWIVDVDCDCGSFCGC